MTSCVHRFNCNYGVAGSLDDRISRLESLADASATLEAYRYVGMGAVATRTHPQPGLVGFLPAASAASGLPS
jgi:hypothetical protein